MSYCRWSSDSFRCDLYCYEHVDGGWTTHVAGNRIPDDAPRELPMPSLDPHTEEGKAAWDAFWPSHHGLHAYLQDCERTPIGLPHDGETFSDPTLADFRARIVALRELGYRCPDYVLESIDEEIRDQNNTEKPQESLPQSNE